MCEVACEGSVCRKACPEGFYTYSPTSPWQKMPQCFVEQNFATIYSTDYMSFNLETRISTEVLTSSMYEYLTRTNHFINIRTDKISNYFISIFERYLDVTNNFI